MGQSVVIKTCIYSEPGLNFVFPGLASLRLRQYVMHTHKGYTSVMPHGTGLLEKKCTSPVSTPFRLRRLPTDDFSPLGIGPGAE